MPIFATPYPHVMNSLNGSDAPKYTYMVFYSNVENGQMWCPDCRAVESTVQNTFAREDQPKAIFYWVGSKAEWRTPENKARVDWNAHNVPTILRIQEGKEVARLVEDDILDEAKLKAFVNPDQA